MAGSGRVRRTRPSGGLTHARLVSGLTCSHGHLGPPGVGQLLARAVLGVWCKGGGGLGARGPPHPLLSVAIVAPLLAWPLVAPIASSEGWPGGRLG